MSAILNQPALLLPRWITQLLMLLLITVSMITMLRVAQPWPQISLLAPLMATMIILGTGASVIFLLRRFHIQKQFFLIPLAGTYGVFALAAITAAFSPHDSSINYPSTWEIYSQFGFCGFIIIAMLYHRSNEETLPKLNRFGLGKNTLPFMLTPLIGIILYMLAINAGTLFVAILGNTPVASAPLGWGSWAIAAATFGMVFLARGNQKWLTLLLSIAVLSQLSHISQLLVDNTLFSVTWHMAQLFSLFSSCILLAVLILQLSQFARDLARSHAELREKAHKDSLTGIYNRGYFDEMLETEWHRIQRTGSPISILMLDIDHFKAYNDWHGHLKGDKCLQKIAQIIQANLQRAGDCAARFGGDEFVVLLPYSTAEGCHEIAQKLHQAIQKLKLPAPNQGKISVSIGHATWLGHHATRPITELLSQADMALYTAKSLGRNRIVRYEDLEPGQTSTPALQSSEMVANH